MRRARWFAATLALTLALSSCGDARVRLRYQAERELWNAAHARRELPARSSRHPGLLELALRYETLGERYQQREVSDSLSAEIQNLAGRAWIGAANCYLSALDSSKAARLLDEKRPEFAGVPPIAGEMAWKQGALAEVAREHAVALSDYELAMDAIPPDPGAESAADSVLRLPVRLVRLAILAADSIEVARVTEKARRTYFQYLEADSLDVRRQALWYLADLEELEGSGARAMDLLAELEAMVLEDWPLDFEPGEVRLRQFEVRVAQWFAGSAPLDALTPFVEDFIHDYPDRNLVGRALWALGCAARDRGLAEDALRIFSRIRLRYHRARIAPRAMLTRARLFDRLGRWHDAYLVYRLLETEYPLSEAGLEVPLELARHYQRNENPIASHEALLDARERYEELAERFPAGPHSVGLLQRRIDVHEELGEYETVVQSILSLSKRFSGTPRELTQLLRAYRVARDRSPDRDSAAAILARIVQRFPQTRTAEWARQTLAPESR